MNERTQRTEYQPGFGSIRSFEPLDADHPLVQSNIECSACRKVFVVGDRVGLIMIGPGDDPEAQESARDGRAYNAVSVPAHWKCITGEDL